MSTLTAPSSDVRLAIPSDEEGVVDLLRAKHLEDGIALFDEDKVRAIVRRGIARDFAVIGVIRGKDMIEATIGLYVSEWWYSRERHLSNPFLYVDERRRKSPHAKSLIHFAKNYSSEIGIPLVAETISTQITAQKEKLFERELPKRGHVFIFNAPQAVAAA